MYFTLLTVSWFGMWERSLIYFVQCSASGSGLSHTMPKRRSYTWHLNNWVILSEVGWIDSFNLDVNIFFNYFLNWCIYDCSMPESPLAGVPLSEIQKVKSWPYVVTWDILGKARCKTQGDIQTEPILHARHWEWSILVRVLQDRSIGMESTSGQLG